MATAEPKVIVDSFIDLVDLDEAQHELFVRGLVGFESPIAIRQSLRAMFTVGDPDKFVERDVVNSLNPDVEYQVMVNKLENVRWELKEDPVVEQTRHRVQARLFLLELRGRRMKERDPGNKKFVRLLREIQILKELVEKTQDTTRDEMDELTTQFANFQGPDSVRQGESGYQTELTTPQVFSNAPTGQTSRRAESEDQFLTPYTPTGQTSRGAKPENPILTQDDLLSSIAPTGPTSRRAENGRSDKHQGVKPIVTFDLTDDEPNAIIRGSTVPNGRSPHRLRTGTVEPRFAHGSSINSEALPTNRLWTNLLNSTAQAATDGWMHQWTGCVKGTTPRDEIWMSHAENKALGGAVFAPKPARGHGETSTERPRYTTLNQSQEIDDNHVAEVTWKSRAQAPRLTTDSNVVRERQLEREQDGWQWYHQPAEKSHESRRLDMTLRNSYTNYDVWRNREAEFATRNPLETYNIEGRAEMEENLFPSIAPTGRTSRRAEMEENLPPSIAPTGRTSCRADIEEDSHSSIAPTSRISRPEYFHRIPNNNNGLYSTVRNPVHRWKLPKFNGSEEELPRFLAMVEEFAKAENVTKQEVFNNRIHLFTGDAADFIMMSPHLRSWDHLTEELRRYCSGAYSDWDLMRRIEKRTQGEENSAIYCTRMEFLFKGLRQQPPEEDKIDVIIRGLKPAIRRAVAGNTAIRTIHQLRMTTQRIEKLLVNSEDDYRGIELINSYPDVTIPKNANMQRESKSCDREEERTRPKYRKDIICWFCQRKGHYKYECRSPHRIEQEMNKASPRRESRSAQTSPTR